MTNLAHSPLGPSSAERWINCPASVRMTEHVVEVPSRYAAEGTTAHWLAQKCFSEGIRPETQLGEKATFDGFEIEVDQEMVEGVIAFLDHMNDLPPGIDFNESRVHYETWVKGGFGTLDRARVSGDTVYLRDLKYGKGVMVFAKDNAQLKLYAAGFIEDYGWMFPEVTKFNLGIVQPRLDHIDEWEISLDDLLAWLKDVVVPGAKLTEASMSPLKAGKHCQFCKIRSTCMVRANSIFTELVGDFDHIDIAIEQAKEVKGPTEAKDPFLTNDQIGRALAALPNIKAWCKDLESYAMRELQQGHDVGGWYMAEGRSNRTWGVDESTLLREARESGIFDPKVLYEDPKLKTPPALEKVIGKTHPLLRKEGVVKKPAGKPVLAPPGDGRPPMTIDVLKEFSDFDNQ